jgi:hypothetical protein
LIILLVAAAAAGQPNTHDTLVAAAAAFVPMITMLRNVNIVLEMQRTIQLCGLSKYLNYDGHINSAA